jgi:hypothetical protein
MKSVMRELTFPILLLSEKAEARAAEHDEQKGSLRCSTLLYQKEGHTKGRMSMGIFA